MWKHIDLKMFTNSWFFGFEVILKHYCNIILRCRETLITRAVWKLQKPFWLIRGPKIIRNEKKKNKNIANNFEKMCVEPSNFLYTFRQI